MEKFQNIVHQLEGLVAQDAESRRRTCADLGDSTFDVITRAKVMGSHCQYVKGLNDALRVVAENYGAEYKEISPQFTDKK